MALHDRRECVWLWVYKNYTLDACQIQVLYSFYCLVSIGPTEWDYDDFITHQHTCTCTRACAHIHSHMHACTYACTHAHRQACARTHKHTHHRQTDTHTHKHTHLFPTLPLSHLINLWDCTRWTGMNPIFVVLCWKLMIALSLFH